ncbi:hypothetical protein PS1_007875 [Malus domestica]|uniref:uncharacterized protein n=1 Tax=Malus domestica TaxID=3750 RepID=UPI0010AA1EB3|nr:uncharacterized protein LOC103448920 [Malus domestica]
MPFPMKIQPIDFRTSPEDLTPFEPVKPVAAKSRLKRLFERPFTNVLKSSAATEKASSGIGIEEPHFNKDGCGGGSAEFEPSSMCLTKMVQNFIEESNEKQSSTAARCSRNRCNCFNGNCNDSSEDESELFGGFGDSNVTSSAESCELLKGLVSCQSVSERNLLADTAKIVEKNKACCKQKDDTCRTVVSDSLLALGYDASVCKSRWEKAPSYPAGEYDYIDVIVKGERLLIDVDFRSEFEIARPTKSYKAILQTLPYIFVGKHDRLWRIIAVVSEAAKQSLKKKGMPVPPWRKAEYIRAKWLSPHTRATPAPSDSTQPPIGSGESELSLGGTNSVEDGELGDAPVFELSASSGEEEKAMAAAKEWNPPELKPKRSTVTGVKIVTGLASVIEYEP